MTMSHTYTYTYIGLTRSEFSLLDSQFLVHQTPDILICNDRDVKRLKIGDQVGFYIVNDRRT